MQLQRALFNKPKPIHLDHTAVCDITVKTRQYTSSMQVMACGCVCVCMCTCCCASSVHV